VTEANLMGAPQSASHLLTLGPREQSGCEEVMTREALHAAYQVLRVVDELS
jgi:hypothetical protein